MYRERVDEAVKQAIIKCKNIHNLSTTLLLLLRLRAWVRGRRPDGVRLRTAKVLRHQHPGLHPHPLPRPGHPREIQRRQSGNPSQYYLSIHL